MKAFVNRDDLTFDEADEQEATQTWDLAEGGAEAYATRVHRFTNVTSLTMYFPDNFGPEATTKLFFCGFQGVAGVPVARDAVVNAVYESTPQIQDHVRNETVFRQCEF